MRLRAKHFTQFWRSAVAIFKQDREILPENKKNEKWSKPNFVRALSIGYFITFLPCLPPMVKVGVNGF